MESTLIFQLEIALICLNFRNQHLCILTFRCGIMHARGIPPASNVTITDIEDYCATFEKKMGSFLQPRADLTDDEAGKLGMKNEEDEVEKFVQVIF